jgi:hypothetical protein
MAASEAPILLRPDSDKGQPTVKAVHLDDRLQVWDEKVGLVFEYFAETGKGVVHVPAGDLSLVADQGAIELCAAKGVRIRSGKDVSVIANDEIALATSGNEGSVSAIALTREGVKILGDKLGMTMRKGVAKIDSFSYEGKTLIGVVDSVRTVFDRLDTTADRVKSYAKNQVQTVEESWITRTGFWRSTVDKVFHLKAETASIKTDEDVVIEGRQIRLG